MLVRAIEGHDQFSARFKYPEPRLVKDEEFGGVNVKEFEVNSEIVTARSAAREGTDQKEPVKQ